VLHHFVNGRRGLTSVSARPSTLQPPAVGDWAFCPPTVCAQDGRRDAAVETRSGTGSSGWGWPFHIGPCRLFVSGAILQTSLRCGCRSSAWFSFSTASTALRWRDANRRHGAVAWRRTRRSVRFIVPMGRKPAVCGFGQRHSRPEDYAGADTGRDDARCVSVGSAANPLACVIAALLPLAVSDGASADEAGVSFWLQGQYGGFAACPQSRLVVRKHFTMRGGAASIGFKRGGRFQASMSRRRISS
jgi:hypothetical protein